MVHTSWYFVSSGVKSSNEGGQKRDFLGAREGGGVQVDITQHNETLFVVVVKEEVVIHVSVPPLLITSSSSLFNGTQPGSRGHKPAPKRYNQHNRETLFGRVAPLVKQSAARRDTKKARQGTQQAKQTHRT